MNIAIIGATGKVGARIVAEALRREHRVTGISRERSELDRREGFRHAKGDANEPTALAPILAGHDVVVSSLPFQATRPELLIDAVRRSGVTRYLVIGGAGSLQTTNGRELLDAPDFPASARHEAGRGKTVLEVLRSVDDLDWTMLSPSAPLTWGERTGTFRLGRDTLLTAADGKSWITYEDYAIAMLDEIESPQHMRRRFTVGYYMRKHLAVFFIVAGCLRGSFVLAQSTSADDPTRVHYQTVAVEGVDVCYREAGRRGAPTIVLLHGFPSSSFMFRDLIPRLAGRFHVLAPDYPGYGQSDAPPPSQYRYTFDRVAQTVQGFLDKLGASRYILYMQDFGGPVGFRLAMTHPAPGVNVPTSTTVLPSLSTKTTRLSA